jgi:hypothetical protein
MLFFAALLCDGGELSTPISIYCMIVIGYLAVRMTIAQYMGFPQLSPFQRIVFVLLPFWGPLLALYLIHGTQAIRDKFL